MKLQPGQQAVYLDDWKMIVAPDTGQHHLYALATDYLEQVDVAAQHPDVVKRMDATLQQEVQRSAALRTGAQRRQVDVSAEQYERLRALGYAR